MSDYRNVRILSTGSYVPEKILTNQDLERMAPTSASWVEENLGIKERHIAAEGEFTSDLASAAALDAINRGNLNPEDIELIIVATATPDRKAPSTACLVHEKIPIRHCCPAFDIGAVCSGFLYGMTIAAQFIQAGQYRKVLVIGADTFSKITDWNSRDSVFFGDGAGAVVMQRTEEPTAFFASEIYANGAGKDNFTVFPNDLHFTMNGKAVYETGSSVLPEAIQSLLRKHGFSIEDVSLVIPHQPSVRLLRKTAEVLGLPLAKMKMNMSRYANTAGATVPLLLDQTNKAGEIRCGDLLVFAAVGAGWTWGASLYRWC